MTSIRLTSKVRRNFQRQLGKSVANSLLSLIPRLNSVGSVAFTVGTENTNVVLVTLQLKNENGDNLAARTALRFYLSSDAAGATPAVLTSAAAAGASGAVVDGATNGGVVITTAAGLAILSLTDTGAITRYVNVILPSGAVVTSPAATWT